MPKQTQKQKVEFPDVSLQYEVGGVSPVRELIDPDFDRVSAPPETEQLIQVRLAILAELTAPVEISVQSNAAYSGFIHPGTDLYSNYLFRPLHLNDTAPYLSLVEILRHLRVTPAWAGEPLDRLVDFAIAITVNRYFGHDLITPAIEEANQTFYMDLAPEGGPIDLRQFYQQICGTAFERAALAQNLRVFLGRPSFLVISPNCRFGSFISRLHAYTLTGREDGQWQLFDNTRAVFIYGDAGELYSTMPAVYPVSEQQRDALMEGESVEIMHRDLNIEREVCDITKRIYAGPIPS